MEIVSEVKNGKPAPDIYLYAAEKNWLKKIGGRAEECFAFER